MEFQNPHMLYGLFLAPALVFLLAWGGKRRRETVRVFAGDRLSDALAPGHSWRKELLKGSLKTTALVCIVIALAGPRFGSQLVKVEREGVDLVIALDTSLSMLAEDMLPNRLERAKQEIVDLIRGLEGDRVGLVVFAGDAFALCPLTVDYDAALMFANSVDVDAVSEPGTALDKALETSAQLFETSTRTDRAIILVTDGENHEGDPVGVARKVRETGVRIYTIGIGNPAGELIPERGTEGSIAGYKKDRRGKTVLTQLDEATLQAVAEAGGGKYLPATREGLELKILYNEISGMERKTIKGEFVERRKQRFGIFLIGALLVLLCDALISSKALKRGRVQRGVLHTGAAALLFGLLAAPSWVEARSVDAAKVKAGNAYYTAGEYDKALTLYRESLGDTLRPPKNTQGVLYNQGNALFMRGDYKNAIECYQKAYSDDSTLTGQMLYNRGNAMLKAGGPGEAVESYVQALQYLPDDEDVRHNLELALSMLKQQQQQKQQQKKQSGDQNQENNDKQQNEQQQGDQQQKDQQQGQQDQQQDQGEQEKEKQQEKQDSQAGADSLQVPPPQPDSTAVPPPQLDPQDMVPMSKEDAMRILQALEEQERQVQRERRRAAFRRAKKGGKDW